MTLLDRCRRAAVGAAVAGAACHPLGAGADAFATDAATIQCPGLFTLLVVPSQAEVGGSVSVTATAPLGMEAGATTFSWSAPSGSFSDPGASVTNFTCTEAGEVMVVLTAAQDGCSEMLGAPVDCLAGDGAADDASGASAGDDSNGDDGTDDSNGDDAGGE